METDASESVVIDMQGSQDFSLNAVHDAATRTNALPDLSVQRVQDQLRRWHALDAQITEYDSEIDAITTVLANLKENTIETEEAKVALPRHLKNLVAARTVALAKLEKLTSKLTAGESVAIPDAHLSAKSITLKETLKETVAAHETKTRQSHAKYLSWFGAGVIGNLGSFGVASLLALTVPYGYIASPLIAATLHTLFNDVITAKIRDTTWTQPAMKQLTEWQRIKARALGDEVREKAGLEIEKKFSLNGEQLTAREMLEKLPSYNHLRNEIELTENVPYSWFMVNYAIRNALPELGVLSAYAGNPAAAIVSQLIASGLSGGLTSLTMMLARKWKGDGNGAVEDVTKTEVLWAQEAIMWDSVTADIEAFLADKDVPAEKKLKLQLELETAKANATKARAHTSFLGGYFYELTKVLQSKQIKTDSSEIPGNRTQTLTNIAGKWASLFLNVAANAVAPAALRDSNAAVRWVSGIVAPPLALIPGGFYWRYDFQAAFRNAIGLAKGAKDANAFCPPGEDIETGQSGRTKLTIDDRAISEARAVEFITKNHPDIRIKKIFSSHSESNPDKRINEQSASREDNSQQSTSLGGKRNSSVATRVPIKILESDDDSDNDDVYTSECGSDVDTDDSRESV